MQAQNDSKQEQYNKEKESFGKVAIKKSLASLPSDIGEYIRPNLEAEDIQNRLKRLRTSLSGEFTSELEELLNDMQSFERFLEGDKEGDCKSKLEVGNSMIEEL